MSLMNKTQCFEFDIYTHSLSNMLMYNRKMQWWSIVLDRNNILHGQLFQYISWPYLPLQRISNDVIIITIYTNQANKKQVFLSYLDNVALDQTSHSSSLIKELCCVLTLLVQFSSNTVYTFTMNQNIKNIQIR